MKLGYCLVVLLLCSGCKKQDVSTAGPNDSYVPLPHTKNTSDTAQELIQRSITLLPGYCDSLREWLRVMPDNLVMIAQCEAAMRSCQDRHLFGQQPPIAIYAAYGLNGDGDPYFKVESFNTNRETHRVLLMFRGPNRKEVRVLKQIDLEDKLPGLQIGISSRVHFMQWSEIVDLASETTSGRLQITVQDEEHIPYPIDEDIAACAYIEDRTGRLSNAVDVYRVDFAKAP